MLKRQALLLIVLVTCGAAAYAGLAWWSEEAPPNDLRDAAASAPETPGKPGRIPLAPPPMFVAGGMGVTPGMPYALPVAPRRLLASLDR
jgi:hypothetical protein